MKCRSFFSITALVAVINFFPLAANATESKTIFEEAVIYSERFNVSVKVAEERLQLQNDAGDLANVLASRETGNFAGLWIEHAPEFKVIAQFVNLPDATRQQQYLAGTRLANRFAMRTAQRSLQDLSEDQTFVRTLALQLGLRVDTDIDVQQNQVYIYALNPSLVDTAFAEAAVRMPASVKVVKTTALAEPEVLRGGATITGCTAGFTVRNSSGEQGIATAAHCANSQSFNGISLPFRAQDQQGNQDVQWNSSCGLEAVTNQIITGSGNRSITSTRHRNSQAIGAQVCKYGRTTQMTCGDIGSKSFAPSYVTSASSTFIRMAPILPQYPDLSAGGDSGGPWYVANTAYGIHSGGFNGGQFNGGSIYMAINYISSIGVSVLTSTPGACDDNQPPVAEFTWSNPGGGTQVNFNASSSFDPDGSIVAYSWDFGDGFTSSSSNPSITHFYLQENFYQVTLTVTDNDGAQAIDFQLISTCAPQILCDSGGGGGF